MTSSDADSAMLVGLRSLDAAPPAPLTDLQASRAEATLSAILAIDPLTEAPAQYAGGSTWRPTSRRWAVLVGSAAAVGSLLFNVIAPFPGTSNPAFATWKAVPDRLTPDEAREAERHCREANAEVYDDATQAAIKASSLAFAERRGVWTYVMFAGANGFGASCLTDTNFNLGNDGRVGVPDGYHPPSSREILIGDAGGLGVINDDGSRNFTGQVNGYAGADVAKIVVLTSAKGPVEATLGLGRFAAWWPESEELFNLNRPKPPYEPTFTTFEVTFTDGTTQRITLADLGSVGGCVAASCGLRG